MYIRRCRACGFYGDIERFRPGWIQKYHYMQYPLTCRACRRERRVGKFLSRALVVTEKGKRMIRDAA